MNNAGELNRSYSQGSVEMGATDAFKKAGGKGGPSKFCFTFDLDKGFKIIGFLEVVAAIIQIFNFFIFSHRVGFICFVLFNLPLLTLWVLSQKSKRDGNMPAAYKWNSLFMSIYSIRLFFIIIGGFVLLIVAQNEDSIIDFLCARYEGVSLDDTDTTAEKKKEFYEDRSECRSSLRILGILFYFPLVMFQVHCLQILLAYRATIENKEYQEEFDNEEDI